MHAIMRACWAEEKDIAEEDVIRACLQEAGFDLRCQQRGCCQVEHRHPQRTPSRPGVRGAVLHRTVLKKG
jgi:2-hydroxychromene-2-carboxylate isomerase